MPKRDRHDASAPARDLASADDCLRRPVAAFDQHIRAQRHDEFQRRVLVEPRHQVNRRERRDDRSAARKIVDRSIGTLVEPANGLVGVERGDEARPERLRLGEVGDVAPMQDVEAAVGEYQRAGKRPRSGDYINRGAELGLELRAGEVDRMCLVRALCGYPCAARP